MIYKYKAKRGPKETVEGSVEALNQDVAAEKLIDRGLIPVALTEVPETQIPKRTAPRQSTGSRGESAAKKGRTSAKEIIEFSRKMRTLLNSSVPILTALDITMSHTRKKELRDAVRKMAKTVSEGETFSNSLGQFPAMFSPLYINIVKAGEATGNLSESLEHIISYLEYREDLLSKVRSSLIYPSMIILTGIGTVFVIMTFVIPKLQGLFQDFSGNMPAITRLLLGSSDFLNRSWPLVVGVLIAAGVSLFATRNKPWQINARSMATNSIPVISGIIKKRNLSNFAFSLEALFRSGVGIFQALDISAPSIYDQRAIYEIREATKKVMSGSKLEEAFTDTCSYIPEFFIKMLAIGEASGKLDDVLHELAESYKREVELGTKMLVSLIEPVAILAVGIVMGIVVMALVLPIFEMSFIIE